MDAPGDYLMVRNYYLYLTKWITIFGGFIVNTVDKLTVVLNMTLKRSCFTSKNG